MASEGPTSNETINGASAPTPVSTDIAKQYDLLPKLIPNLDRHLVFPVLEFIENKEDEDPMEIKQLKFELLKETNMSDYVGALEMEIKGLSEKPAEYTKKRDDVLKRREQYEEETNNLTSLLENPEVTGALRSDKVANLQYLKDTHNVTLEEVNKLYDFGQFMYSVGDYQGAADLLFQFRLLVSSFQVHRSKFKLTL